jgi:hypothetical protein
MKATPENKVKQKLVAYLKTIPNLFYYTATAGPMSTGGIPDIMGCHKGRLFGIEVKAPGRRGEKNRGASNLQVMQMHKIREAGGFAMMFDGEELDWITLRNWIEEAENGL